jgi:hypothetical protein
MATVPNKLNGGFKTIILAIALIANGIAVGVYYGRTEERLQSIDDRLHAIERGIDDRYRGTDAKADFNIRDKRLDRLEAKVDKHILDGGA